MLMTSTSGMLSVKEITNRYNAVLGKYELLSQQASTLESDLQRLQDTAVKIVEANTVVQEVASDLQIRVKVHVDALVTKALSVIYPESNLKFSLKFVAERGQTSVYPMLFSDDQELDPMSSSGGMAEIIAFALRIALLIIGKRERIVILDEPFTGVSAQRIPDVQKFMTELSRDLGVQFMVTTHISEFLDSVMSGDNSEQAIPITVFEVKRGADGVSKVDVKALNADNGM